MRAVRKTMTMSGPEARAPLSPLLHHRPRHVGQGLGAVAVLGGGLRRGVAVEAALVDALDDGGEAEQREGEVEVEGRHFLAAGPPRIGREVLRFARDAERLEVEAAIAARGA